MQLENIQKEGNLNDIIIILNEINKDIIHLHRYAAEDFTLMRSVFRENNYKAEQLEKNAKKAFDMIGTSKESDALVMKIGDYFDSLSDCNQYIRSKTGSLSEYENDLRHYFEQMIIPVKNINQHIVSLKLVLSNIRLYPSFTSQSKTLHYDADLMCDRIRNLDISLSEGIKSMEALLENLSKEIESIEKIQLEEFIEFLNKVDKCKGQYMKKHREALSQIPELSAKIIDNIGNSHKIIVELQYHDIIRQKIEHIQETHDQIIQRLTQYQNDNGTFNNNEISKYLFQVGDIVRIQASQLLQANKEYESAIDNISEELLSFSDNMTGITNLCKRLSLYSNNVTDCGIEDTIRSNADMRYKMSEADKLMDAFCLSVKNELASMFDVFSEIKGWIIKLNSSLSGIEDKDPDLEESRKISNTQISELLKNLSSTTFYLQKLFDKILGSGNKQFVELTRNDKRKKFNEILEKMLDHEQKSLPEFNKNNETINAIFEENGNYTRNLADEILAAIRSIKYYDYFDKLANKIIQKLNYISETYYNSDSKEERYDIEYIKQKYTMGSERKIHDKALEHGAGSFELFDKSDEPSGSKRIEIF